jgi:hypothetical protein
MARDARIIKKQDGVVSYALINAVIYCCLALRETGSPRYAGELA